ncbi:hypothetical protein [Enemella sp. A6]|uniref:hypothetical protein n=1 Tax=Enemella sp. A6 TaxID=3440152 RepID=UPI003EBBEB83
MRFHPSGVGIGYWQRGRGHRFTVHTTFGLPFFAQPNMRDHRTRTRVAGEREVYAFEYLPELLYPNDACTRLAESSMRATHLTGLATRLSRGLTRFLVTDDYFSVLPRLLNLPRADVQLPADRDPYDGRVWAAHGDAALIESALVGPVWELLDNRGPGPAMNLLTDGRWLLWFPHDGAGRRRGANADLLAAVADLLEAELQQGLLDPWTIDPAEYLGSWQGTDFQRIAALPSVLFYLWSIRSLDYLGEMITGHHAGVDFIAVAGARPVVLVELAHRVPDHVRVLRSRLRAGGGIDTEWHEFNRDYLITAGHERIGHAVATPRLIQFLHDQGIDRIDVKGPWVSTLADRFEPADIRRTVERLAKIVDYLPSFPVGDLAIDLSRRTGRSAHHR